MQKHVSIILILALAILAGCQKPKKKFSTSLYNPASTGFAFLNEPLKDVRVLALGESSHGFGSMHALKANLVKYLHQELGYDVLVMEAGYGDLRLAWHNIDKSTPTQLINTTVNDNLRSRQLLPLFEYMTEIKDSENPLELRGMDPRISGFGFKFRLMHVIKRLEPKVIQDSIARGILDYQKTFEVLDDKEQWETYMTSYNNALDFAKSILVESREDIKELEIVEEVEVDVLIKNIDMLKQAVNYNFGEAYTRGLSIRDSLMAENVFYFANEEFPNSKIVIWGHNGHIEKGPGEGDNIKWVGHYLKEKFKDKYYAMGMYAKKGMIYQTSARKVSNFDIADPSFIEAKIENDYGKYVFLDLPAFDATNDNWINKPIFGYELEAGGKVNFVPSKRFDGIMLMSETEAPQFIITGENQRRGQKEQ